MIHVGPHESFRVQLVNKSRGTDVQAAPISKGGCHVGIKR